MDFLTALVDAFPYLILSRTAYSMSAAKTNIIQPSSHISSAIKDIA
jgi:hypothetical protein